MHGSTNQYKKEYPQGNAYITQGRGLYLWEFNGLSGTVSSMSEAFKQIEGKIKLLKTK